VPPVDDYLATLDEPARAVLGHLRAVAVEVAPDAEQGRSYGLAALRYRGKPLLGFLATSKHLSLFPFSPAALDPLRDRLVGFDLAKGTLRFPTDRPPPDDVVRDLVRNRMAEIDA
jgi:uncharacterized protein YdhG (YjbR/CyaY superfamily)